jgi:iron complex transport system ATP-binding protein
LLQAADLAFGYSGSRARGGATAPRVLDGVSVSLPKGGMLGILGPNGSGKTTLLRLLAGTLTPTRGEVTLEGTPLPRIPRRELARRIAVVPQETHLAFDYSVLEMVLMGRHAHLGAFQLEGPQDLAIAREAMRATGVGPLEGRSFTTLSGGEKQRVGIAAALAQSADILLLDEPTASLDLGAQLEIAALLSHLNRTHGVTMAVSTHDLGLAAGVCRDMLLLRHGRALATGPTDDVLTAAHVRALYDVEADVHVHEGTGHVMVVPLRRLR